MPVGRISLITLCWLVAACRDLELPQKQVGRVSGIAVMTDASGRTSAAAGVIVSVVGTSLRATTTEAGVFSLEPITSTTGSLVLASDADGDGTPERSRSLDFEQWQIGPNRSVALGEISLRSSVTLEGHVLLEGAGLTANAGTSVFIPGLPLTTTTSDTGVFRLSGAPEGPLTLAAAHAGYQRRSSRACTPGQAN